MINYSIVMRSVNANLFEINQAKSRIKQAEKDGVQPEQADIDLVKTEVQNAYAIAQYADVMTIEKFARHIANHGCVYSRADISAILYMAVDCMREQLLEGKKIRLGDLGDFSVSLTSKGAKDAKSFSAQNITGVNVVWDCGQEFKNLLADAEFNLVASRSAQAAVLKAIKDGSNTVDLNAKGDGDGTDPDGGGNGGGGNTQGSGSNNSGSSGTGGGSTDNGTSGTSQKYTVSVASNDPNMGTVTGGGEYAKDSQATIKAEPKSGYLFDQWSDGNQNAERTISVTRNQTLVATFYPEGGTRPSEEENELPPAE